MPLTHIIVLALIQGLTEFLPVSSSAHLIFPSQILGWEDQGLSFDVAVHVGTLLAVIIYYMSDLVQISTDMIESVVRKKVSPRARVGYFIVIATIPAGVFGLLFEEYISTIARSIEVIAYTTIIFGLLLGLASYINRKLCWSTIVKVQGARADSLRHLSLQHAVIIGFAQALALIPGTSRSGVTLTAGLFLGLRPEAAARFSFLLSIPIILASAALETYKIATNEIVAVNPMEMVFGVVISFITAILVIHFFLKYISKAGMKLFVIYRLILGVALLYICYS